MISSAAMWRLASIRYRRAIGNIEAGRLRAIAVASPARSAALPDVPTAAESGLPGLEAVQYYGLLAPAGIPRPIVERLNGSTRTCAR
jgi:tripartite-type tricarboxylate transporter receptor subunit TctC